MKIGIIKGHLTQTEKTHIKAVLKAGLKEAKVNTKEYYLTLISPDFYNLTIKEWRKNDYNKREQIIYKSIFKIN